MVKLLEILENEGNPTVKSVNHNPAEAQGSVHTSSRQPVDDIEDTSTNDRALERQLADNPAARDALLRLTTQFIDDEVQLKKQSEAFDALYLYWKEKDLSTANRTDLMIIGDICDEVDAYEKEFLALIEWLRDHTHIDAVESLKTLTVAEATDFWRIVRRLSQSDRQLQYYLIEYAPGSKIRDGIFLERTSDSEDNCARPDKSEIAVPATEISEGIVTDLAQVFAVSSSTIRPPTAIRILAHAEVPEYRAAVPASLASGIETNPAFRRQVISQLWSFRENQRQVNQGIIHQGNARLAKLKELLKAFLEALEQDVEQRDFQDERFKIMFDYLEHYTDMRNITADIESFFGQRPKLEEVAKQWQTVVSQSESQPCRLKDAITALSDKMNELSLERSEASTSPSPDIGSSTSSDSIDNLVQAVSKVSLEDAKLALNLKEWLHAIQQGLNALIIKLDELEDEARRKESALTPDTTDTSQADDGESWTEDKVAEQEVDFGPRNVKLGDYAEEHVEEKERNESGKCQDE